MHITRDANLLGALTIALGDGLMAGLAQAGQAPGLRPAALVHLLHCERRSIDSLRRAVGLSHSAAVRLVDGLVAERLVARTSDPTDARAVAVVLTDAGRVAAERALDARARYLETVLEQALTPEERGTLESLLDKLLRTLGQDRHDLWRICRLCDFEACPDCPVDQASAA